jgi:hypothetical protein
VLERRNTVIIMAWKDYNLILLFSETSIAGELIPAYVPLSKLAHGRGQHTRTKGTTTHINPEKLSANYQWARRYWKE